MGTARFGDSSIQLFKFGASEARLTSALRVDKIFRALGGFIGPTVTTTERDALPVGEAPFGLVILNTTKSQYEWNGGSDAARVWVPASMDGLRALVGSRFVGEQVAVGTAPTFESRVIGDTTPRLRIWPDGDIEWGAGGVPDVLLHRSNANELTLDDSLIVTGDLTVNGAAFGVMAPGNVVMHAGMNVPDGFLLCDGTAYSRATFAGLFGEIGTMYGVGDGVTTFNVPNIAGRVVVGMDMTQTEFDAMNEKGGAKTVVLTESQMPSHDHSAGTLKARAGLQNTTTATGSTDRLTGPGATELDVIGDTGSAGSGAAHNNLQPYIVLHYLIKV